jgi:hypothetical protein
MRKKRIEIEFSRARGGLSGRADIGQKSDTKIIFEKIYF